jgi:hypothetical protein
VRRPTAAAALVACALLAGPASAAPPATVPDAVGDWPVASQDIRTVRLTTFASKAGPMVRATLDLSAAPDAATQYVVTFGTGCTWWGFVARNLGTDAFTSTFGTYPCSDDAAGAATRQPDAIEADVLVTGTTIQFTVPYALGLRRGFRVATMEAGASPAFTGLYVGHGLGDRGFVTDGDLAYGSTSYVIR